MFEFAVQVELQGVAEKFRTTVKTLYLAFGEFSVDADPDGKIVDTVYKAPELLKVLERELLACSEQEPPRSPVKDQYERVIVSLLALVNLTRRATDQLRKEKSAAGEAKKILSLAKEGKVTIKQQGDAEQVLRDMPSTMNKIREPVLLLLTIREDSILSQLTFEHLTAAEQVLDNMHELALRSRRKAA